MVPQIEPPNPSAGIVSTFNTSRGVYLLTIFSSIFDNDFWGSGSALANEYNQ